MTRTAVLCLLALPLACRADDKAPAWAAPMKKVHAKFAGDKGTLALFGDSITVSHAFWSPLADAPKGMDDATKADYELMKGRLKKECYRDWRGPDHGSDSGMTIRWADENVAKWLKKTDPETAVILFGTNDITSVPLDEYEKKLRAVVQKCLDNGTVVVLTTPPPRSGMLDKSEQFADAVRKVAKHLNVPVCDFHAEVLARRKDDWDGAAKAFAKYETYEVPTLIATDGVHPSNPKKYANDFSAEALKCSGFGLRNYLTMRSYAAVIRDVYAAKR